MEGIIPREVSHVSPCDAASAPLYFPASSGMHTDFRAEFPCGKLPSPVLLHSLGGVGLQMSKQIQVISVQNRSLKTPANSKTQHPSTHVLQHGPLSPCAILLGGQALQQGRRGQRKSCSGGMQSVIALVEGLSNNLLGRPWSQICMSNLIKSPQRLISSAEHLRCCTFICCDIPGYKVVL